MGKFIEHCRIVALLLHCRKKIGDVLIVSEQVQIICRPLGIRIDQFVEH